MTNMQTNMDEVVRRADEIKVDDVIMHPITGEWIKVVCTEIKPTQQDSIIYLYFSEDGKSYMGAFPWHKQIVQIELMRHV